MLVILTIGVKYKLHYQLCLLKKFQNLFLYYLFIDKRKIMSCRGRRKSRELTVETYGRVDGTAPVESLIDENSKKIDFLKKPNSKGSTPKGSKKKHRNKRNNVENVSNAAEQINFISGNPFVEVTNGVLHVYKEK